MFILKEKEAERIKRKYKETYIAEEVGISTTYVSLILARKKTCPKRTAFCIAKTISENAEIDDFFERSK